MQFHDFKLKDGDLLHCAYCNKQITSDNEYAELVYDYDNGEFVGITCSRVCSRKLEKELQ